MPVGTDVYTSNAYASKVETALKQIKGVRSGKPYYRKGRRGCPQKERQ